MSPVSEATSPARLARPYLLWLIPVGLILFLLQGWFAVWWEVSNARHRFERDSQASFDLVSRRLNENETVLGGLDALYRALDDVDRDQLALYAGEMLRRYPHIGYIEYAERVAGEDLPGFEAALHAEGYLSYRVWERDGGARRAVAARDAYYPLVFIEPLSPQSAQFLGLDLASETDLRRAIAQAIDGGGVSASVPFSLPGGQTVYALFKAVYAGLSVPGSVVQRRQRAQRLLVLLVRPERLLDSGDLLTPGAGVALIHPAAGGRVLARIDDSDRRPSLLHGLLPRLVYERRLDGAGQPFELRIEKQLGTEVLRPGMLAGIAGFTLLLMLLLYMRRRFILERQHSRDVLYRHREQAEVTLHAIADAVISVGAQGRIEYMNGTAEQLTGWSLSRARGRGLDEVFPLSDERTGRPRPGPVEECIREGHTVRLADPVLLHGEDGSEHLILTSASPIRDRNGAIVGAVLVFHDVSKERQMENRLAYQASHDALTGLLDRGEFERRLKAALDSAQRLGRQHALCYMDLDQFKVVNDACGHAAGDELLVELSALLMATVRDTDVLARLGGDEFAVLLMDCPPARAVAKAESLRDAVKSFRFVWQGRSFDVSFGIGVVPITKNSGSSTDVLRAADIACYAAKSRGRNQVFIYQSDSPELARHRGEMRWATRIGEALEKQQFQLYYQTIRPIQREEPGLFHCELLMRREDESGRLASPEAFIPAAERFNLMPDIDRWVVSTALPRIAELSRQAARRGERVLCGINLSGQSLADRAFHEDVRRLMEEHAVPAEAVCFEVTETTAIVDFEVARRFIEDMRRRGCRFALDDFGTGVSSFSYLKRLPLDYVKIDGSFIRNLLEAPVDQVMVESINRVAHTLGIQTIAEFVENEALLQRLKELGTDYAQGYGIDRPAPLDERIEPAT